MSGGSGREREGVRAGGRERGVGGGRGKEGEGSSDLEVVDQILNVVEVYNACLLEVLLRSQP